MFSFGGVYFRVDFHTSLSIIGCLGVGDTETSQAFLNEISQSGKGNVLEKVAVISC